MRRSLPIALVALLLATALSFSVAEPAQAQSFGFNYTPLPSPTGQLFSADRYQQAEFNLLFAFLSERVFGGSGDSSVMTGIGTILRTTVQESRFVAFAPQYGMNLFFGFPEDNSGGSRARLSLQVPLALHYFFQLYRDDSALGSDHGAALAPNFTFYGGPLLPVSIDLTTTSFANSMNLGFQVGAVYAVGVGKTVVQANLGIAKYFTGYYYLNDTDTGFDGVNAVTGEPLDLGGALRALYLPWRLSLGVDYHLTNSLDDIDGDTVQILSIQAVYFPD